MSPILRKGEIYNPRTNQAFPGARERAIKRLAGSAFPDLFQRIKDTVESLGTKGQNLLNRFSKAPEPPKSPGLRTAMTTKGNQPSPLNFDALRAAQGITDAFSTAGMFAKNAAKAGPAAMAFPLLDIQHRAVADGTMNSPEARDAEIIWAVNRLFAPKAEQLPEVERQPEMQSAVPPQIVPDDPIAPPVEPTAPIDYMGALGARMGKDRNQGSTKEMQTSYDDGSVAPFAYTPDLKAQYRAAFLDPDVDSVVAMRNADKVLGLDYAGGQYYFDSGRVDANGNPIPVTITDKERRQLKNFEISPTELQMKRNEGLVFNNIGTYTAPDGLKATEMPGYPTDTGEEFDFADVVAALEDLGEKYVPYFTDIDRSRLGF